MFERILVALDGSAASNRGLKAAMELAVDQRATLLALNVVDDLSIIPAAETPYLPADYIDTYLDALRDSGRRTLATAETFARSCGVAFKAVLVDTRGDSVAHTILREAQKLKADVIVLGTHGRRGLRRVLLGSDAEAVVREARVPVLLVRAPERRSPGHRTAKPRRTAARRARKPAA